VLGLQFNVLNHHKIKKVSHPHSHTFLSYSRAFLSHGDRSDGAPAAFAFRMVTRKFALEHSKFRFCMIA